MLAIRRKNLKKKSSMKIVFNKDFYNLKTVKKAAHAYQDFADFEIKNNKNEIKVVLSNIDPDVGGVIGDEFSNYVLAGIQELKKEF